MNYPTILEIARGSGNASISTIIEVLNETNDALQDIPWIACNSGQTHITTIRTGLPTPTWRMLNMGVPKTGSTRAQIKANCGMLEAYSEIDAKEIELAKKGANGQEGAANFIAQENQAMIEGFAQEISRVMFYGDASKIAEPVGFCHYYAKCENPGVTPHTDSAFNCINGGGSGADNTSIWFVTWGPTAIHGIYPAATVAGFKEESLGYHTAQDSLGNQFQIYRTHYQWDAGFCVRDWRAGVRIANLSMTALSTGTSAPDLLALLNKAYYKLKYRGYSGQNAGRTAIYCRPEILEFLDNQTRKQSNLLLTYSDVQGKPVLNYRGIPIRVQQSLLATEGAVPVAS